jgi:hypothetical protein
MKKEFLATISPALDKLEKLSLDEQQQVVDLIEYLFIQKQQKQSRAKRILGLNSGQIKISEDFDQPLPDEFWLGES